MEMMVVVAIIVALAGVGIYYMAGQADEGTKARIKANIKSITDLSVMYKMKHNGEYPPSLEALLAPDPENGNRPWARNDDITDPWGKHYTYVAQGSNNSGAIPDISCTTQWGTFSNWTSKVQ